MTKHHQQAVGKFTADDRFYSAIGRFIFEFSQLEYTLKHHVAEQISLKDEYFDAIMSYDFSLLCTVSESVIVLKLSEKRAANFKKLISSCRGLNRDRVRIVHGLWYIDNDTGALHAVSREKLQGSRQFENDAAGIARKADLANTLRNEFPRTLYT